MIDASHANSNKDFKMQSKVVDDVKINYSQEENIIGIMLESNLVEGNQKINSRDKLRYGQSITDSCIGWEETENIILDLDDTLKKPMKIKLLNTSQANFNKRLNDHLSFNKITTSLLRRQLIKF